MRAWLKVQFKRPETIYGHRLTIEPKRGYVAWNNIPSWSLDVANTIMQTVHVKDPQTYAHCVRVARDSRLLAKVAGLNDYEQKLAEFAGLFHDIGKIGVPDEILLKPAQLTEEEFKVMKSHPEKSVQILAPLAHITFYKELLPGVRHHHERYDGRGYPIGVKGDEIPLESRIILIADTFDAMTADRAYRKGLPAEVAFEEIKKFAGSQFDPQLAKMFLEAKPGWGREAEKVARELQNTVLEIQPKKSAA